jgi:hypothetical protein
MQKALQIEGEQFLTYYKKRGGNLVSDAELNGFITGEGVLLSLIAVYVHAGIVNANISYRRFKAKKLADPEGLNSEWVADILKHFETDNLSLVKKLSDNTRKEIRRLLDESIVAGWGSEKTADAIAKTTCLSITRARRIVRTETISASNYASRMGALRSGLTLVKEWLSTADNRTRGTNPKDKTDHVGVNGQSAEMNGYYQLRRKDGIEYALYPGDPKLSAENRINCRCTETYEAVEVDAPPVSERPQRLPAVVIAEGREPIADIVGRMIKDLTGSAVAEVLLRNAVIYSIISDVLDGLGFDFDTLF